MLMDESDILQDYRYAKNKFHQVRVLAELNCCKPKAMAQWLVDHGETVDKRYFREPPKRKEEPMTEEVKTQTEPETAPPTAPDQTAKADKGKPRLTLVPMQILWDIAAVREWATANKYPDTTNWKQVEPERYHEALLRHVLRYIDNPDGVDDESGLPHLYHVATNVAFLAELEKKNNA
jgi:hypothetical protein